MMRTRIWAPMGLAITLMGGGAQAQTFVGFQQGVPVFATPNGAVIAAPMNNFGQFAPQRRGIGFRLNTFAFMPGATLAAMRGMSVPPTFGQATGFSPLPNSGVNTFRSDLVVAPNQPIVNPVIGNGTDPFFPINPNFPLPGEPGFVPGRGVVPPPGTVVWLGVNRPNVVAPNVAPSIVAPNIVAPSVGTVGFTTPAVSGQGIIPPAGFASPLGFNAGIPGNQFRIGISNVSGRGVIPAAGFAAPMRSFR